MHAALAPAKMCLPLGIQLIGSTEWEATAKVVTGVRQRATYEGSQDDPHAEGCSKIAHGHCL